MRTTLDFEKPIAELESKLAELSHMSATAELDIDIAKEMERLQEKTTQLLEKTYKKLSPWQKVQVARHPERPHTTDYIARLITDFTPLSGDRNFAEDAAIVAGIGKFREMPVMIIGHEKGRDTDLRIKHNFGMPRPEGYRKASRLMQLADRFNLPIFTFIDTAGAHPGLDAEERGQSEALARCLEISASLRVPLIATIIGEGGSGGAVALAFANAIFMLEHSVYSIISPEGCASILWRTRDKKEEAALAQKLTAQDLKGFGMIDDIIPEPLGGAQRNHLQTIDAVGHTLEKALARLRSLDREVLITQRRTKFLDMGR